MLRYMIQITTHLGIAYNWAHKFTIRPIVINYVRHKRERDADDRLENVGHRQIEQEHVGHRAQFPLRHDDV